MSERILIRRTNTTLRGSVREALTYSAAGISAGELESPTPD